MVSAAKPVGVILLTPTRIPGCHHIFSKYCTSDTALARYFPQKTIHPLTATYNKKKSEISHQPCPGSPSKNLVLQSFFLKPDCISLLGCSAVGWSTWWPKTASTSPKTKSSEIYVSETQTSAKAHCHDPRPSARYFNRKLSGK